MVPASMQLLPSLTSAMPPARVKQPKPNEPLVMHGAKLAASKVDKVLLLHALTKKTKQHLHDEAYSLLIAHYEREGILEPTPAEVAERILTTEGKA